MVAGRLMRQAVTEAQRMIRMVACEHKIGMCRCSHDRFFFYHEDGSRWSLWLLALLASTKTREGANMMESSLILHFETTAINAAYNYNWTTACDYGGEGPTREDEAHLEHFVYLAVKPLPPTAESMAAAASAQFGDMTRTPSLPGPTISPPRDSLGICSRRAGAIDLRRILVHEALWICMAAAASAHRP